MRRKKWKIRQIVRMGKKQEVPSGKNDSDGTVDVARCITSKSNTIREIDLNKCERKLLLSVENGDLNSIQHILDNAVSLKVDINCVDPW